MRSVVATVLVVLGGAFAAEAGAQSTHNWNPAQLQVTRAELEELLGRFENASRSDAYSSDLRQRARFEADLVRQRLAEGDFQVGDQIALVVEGEEALRGTFPVTTGRVLPLPIIGDVPLQGVLRSELDTFLTQHLSQYIRTPIVRTQSMIRISITGAVGRPGFYLAPTEHLVTDALMMAGGPSGSADLKKILIERSDRRIWQGEALQQAIIEGRTLDQISLRAGDRIVVPERRAGGVGGVRTVLVTVGSITVLIGRILRWF